MNAKLLMMFNMPTRMAIIRETCNTKFGKDVEKLDISYIADGTVKWYSYSGR